MRVLNKSLLVFALSLIGMTANSQYPEIPLNTFQRPPVDLVDASGKPLQQADLANLFLQNKDISRLNPVEDRFWQAPSSTLATVDPQAEIIRNKVIAAGGVEFSQPVGGNRELGIFSLMVKMKGSSDSYGLTIGTQVHTSLVRAALLRKLGFYQNTPIFFKELKMQFASKQQKEDFITSAFCGQEDKVTETCINIDPFKSELNPRPEPFLIQNGDTGLILRSVYLEVFTPGIPSLIDGITPATPDRVELFGSNRTFRALAVPFMVSDLAESLNRIEQEPAKLRDGRLEMRVNFGGDFRATDHFDLRWALRNMAKLSLKDWIEIVNAGQYPDVCYKQIAYNGLVGRMSNLLKLVNINTMKGAQEDPNIQIPADVLAKIDFHYNCGDSVKDGNLTREYTTGSPIRFSHGLRDSPWGKGDLMRGLLIRLQSGLLQTGLARLSEKITKSKKTATGVIKITPEGPDVLATASDNTIKGMFDGSRIINTGTIMGSEAPVQMVDNLTIGLGYSHSKLADLAGDVMRIGTAGIRVQREFTYVKPIGSMKEATKTNVLDVLNAPSRLEDLAKTLDTGKIAEFLQSMQVNEVYYVTDTISIEGSYGLSYGLGAIKMLGHSVVPAILIGVNGQYNVIGQTMFMRTANGIQVITRKLDPENNREISGSFFVSVKALFEFFHFNWSKTNARYLSDVYNMSYNPEFMNHVCPKVFALMDEYKTDPAYTEADCEGKLNLEAMPDSVEKREMIKTAHLMKRIEPAAVNALRDLIYDSNSDALRHAKVLQEQKATVSNKVDITQNKTGAFWKRLVNVKERQTIMFWEPKGYTSNKTGGLPINIAISRSGQLDGDDKVGFALNVFDAIVKEKLGKNAVALSQNVINPAGMPKGKAFWRVAETQSEISSHGAKDGTKMPSGAMLKYIWGGWSIKQDELNEIIQQVNKRVPEYVRNTSQLVPDGVFNRVGKIDFYQLIITLKIEPQGLENIRNLFLSPGLAVPVDNPTFEDKKNFLRRLAWAFRTKKFRPEDKTIFDSIVELYGREQYMAECAIEHTDPNNGPALSNKKTHAGTEYPCLSQWVENLINVSRKFDQNNIADATDYINDLIFILDEKLPIQTILNAIGIENYRYGVNVFGYRAKDENAVDAAWTSPIFGEPPTADLYQNLLTGELSRRHNLSPLVIDRKMMPF